MLLTLVQVHCEFVCLGSDKHSTVVQKSAHKERFQKYKTNPFKWCLLLIEIQVKGVCVTTMDSSDKNLQRSTKKRYTPSPSASLCFISVT